MGFLTAQTTIRQIRQGVMPYPRGEYSASVTDYYYNEYRRDVVQYSGVYYTVKKYDPLNPVPKGQYPSSTSVYWQITSQYEIVVTAQMIADAIRTNALNVNDKFKVSKDGKVNMIDAEVTGIIHSLGPNTKLVVSDGYVRILYKGEERCRLITDEASGLPELYMNKYAGTNNEISAIYRIDGFSFKHSGGKVLNFSAPTIGEGVIDVNSEGHLFLNKRLYNYVTVTIYALPAAGGGVSPFSGLQAKIEGSTDIVSADPNEGYVFDRWSDGGAQTHSVVWSDGKSLVAYFKKVETPIVNYTITLSASPTGGGSVTGGGTRQAGSTGTITATPADGYMFARWSDNGNQSHIVTWDKTKSLVAYFDPKPTTNPELFVSPMSIKSWTKYSYAGVAVSGSLLSLGSSILFTPAASDMPNLPVIGLNTGQLSGKLKAGHTYHINFTIKANKEGFRLTSFFGYLTESDFDTLGWENLFSLEPIPTTDTVFSTDIKVVRDSILEDHLVIAISGEGSTAFYLKNFSLKEVIE